MEKLLIIDGNNLLFQMYYGMPSKIYNKSGKTIHATIGFVSFVMKQINLYNVTKVVVVFDGDSSSERKELLNDCWTVTKLANEHNIKRQEVQKAILTNEFLDKDLIGVFKVNPNNIRSLKILYRKQYL